MSTNTDRHFPLRILGAAKRILHFFNFSLVSLLGLFALGIFTFSAGSFSIPLGCGILFLTSFLVITVRELKIFSSSLSKPHPKQLSWQTRTLAVLAVLFFLAATGGALSPLHSLLYLGAVIFGLGLTRKEIVWVACFFLVGEIFLQIQAQHRMSLFFSLPLIGVFTSLPWFLLREHRSQLEKEKLLVLEQGLAQIHKEASSYRLGPLGEHVSEPSDTVDSTELVRMQGSLLVMKQTQTLVLDLLCQSLRLHSALLLWLNESEQTLITKTFLCESKLELEKRIPMELGAFGSLIKNKQPLRLSSPKSSHLPYYRKGQIPPNIGSFVGIPLLLSNKVVVGILCFDRLLDPVTQKPLPFLDEEISLGEHAARQLVSSLQSERLFILAERSRDAQERLYQASSQLSQALTLEQVHETTFSALGHICRYDFAAITHFESSSQTHHIAAIHSRSFSAQDSNLVGLSFAENSSLVSMAVKNQLSLPELNVSYETEVPLFGEQIRLKNFPSVLVLPLLRGNQPLGTLVLASQHPRQFGKLQRELLGIITNQVAGSIENALFYQSMEAMATTDGLTQLLNRRTWQDRFLEMLERAHRHKQSLSLLLTDIDYFKKINDTYGHPMGDQVLKRVAEVVLSCVRKFDLAARYGGEEFAVVLDAADTYQAFQLAERIRKEIERLEFVSEQGTFRCTLSIGVANFPKDGRTLTELASHADQALYRAKHQGRNQTMTYESLRKQSAPKELSTDAASGKELSL